MLTIGYWHVPLETVIFPIELGKDFFHVGYNYLSSLPNNLTLLHTL